MIRSPRSGWVLLLCLALTAAAGPADAGASGPRAERRKAPPVREGERISAVVVPGLLLISVGVPRPYRDDGKVHETEPLRVVVRDTRTGGSGWSLGGIAAGFAEQEGTADAADSIRWTPKVLDASPATTVTATASGTGTRIPGDPQAAARPLASSPAGKSIGTAVIQIQLGVPLSERSALFRGDITFTVL